MAKLEIEFLIPLRKRENPGGEQQASIKMAVPGVPQSEWDGIPVFLLDHYDLERRIVVLKNRFIYVEQDEISEVYRNCGVVAFYDTQSNFPMYISNKGVKQVRDLETGKRLYPIEKQKPPG